MKTRFCTTIFILLFYSLYVTAPAYAADPLTIAPSGDTTGQTDADALQAALSDAAPGTLIQLTEGTYYLNHVLLAENFQGTLQGAGQEKTILTTVGELPVSSDVPVWKNPPSLSNPWPFVLTIVDGDVTIQGMTWRVTERVPMRFKYLGDFEIPALPAIIAIISGDASDAGKSLLQDVALEGAEGEFMGYNLIQLLYHEGLIDGPTNEAGKVQYQYPLRGEHRVSDASFKHAFAGNALFNLAPDAKVTIEKSTFVEVAEGVEVLDSGGTVIISNNVITPTSSDGVGIIAMQGYFSVPEDSANPVAPLVKVQVTGNTFYVDGGHAAVDLSDMQYAILGTPPSLDATVEGNQIILSKADYGIIGYGMSAIQLRNNTISGSALYEGTHVSFATHSLTTLQPGDKAQLGAYGKDVLRRAPQPSTITPSSEVTSTIIASPTATTAPAATPATTIAWPGPRNYHQMAYDDESKQVILIGGQLGSMVPLVDTWAYDPAANRWQEMKPSITPPASDGPLAYDEKADRMIFVATLDGMTFGPLSETWSYDYNSDTWEKLAPTHNLSAGMVGARMVYDSESERMILFGGYDIPNDGYFNQTWVFDFAGNTWTQMEPTVAPPGTNFHSMVYDSVADRVILWGSVSDDRMWSYDYNSNTWNEVADSGTPPLMDYTRMVYLPELQQSILFGGVDVPNEVPQGGTWSYDHTAQTWQQLSVTNAPGPRGFHSMIYEPGSKQILLFGGGIDRNRAYGDLWRFDPITHDWTNITPVDAPHTAVAPAEVGYFLTGADKRAGVEHPWFAFYDLPNMDQTHVASLTYKDSLALDLYYPPDFDFTKPLPAVVFVHGVDIPELSRTLKDDGPYVSWGQLVAADGMVGVLYDSTKPGEDMIDLLNYLHTNAARLGIDPQRTCIWASSSNPPPALAAMTQTDAAYYAGLRCAVILYGATERTDGSFPPDFSLMAVRVGHDEPGFYDMMTDLINWAEADGVKVTVVDYEEGEHAFDVFMDTPRTHEIIGQTLAFLQEQLQVKQ